MASRSDTEFTDLPCSPVHNLRTMSGRSSNYRCRIVRCLPSQSTSRQSTSVTTTVDATVQTAVRLLKGKRRTRPNAKMAGENDILVLKTRRRRKVSPKVKPLAGGAIQNMEYVEAPGPTGKYSPKYRPEVKLALMTSTPRSSVRIPPRGLVMRYSSMADTDSLETSVNLLPVSRAPPIVFVERGEEREEKSLDTSPKIKARQFGAAHKPSTPPLHDPRHFGQRPPVIGQRTRDTTTPVQRRHEDLPDRHVNRSTPTTPQGVRRNPLAASPRNLYFDEDQLPKSAPAHYTHF